MKKYSFLLSAFAQAQDKYASWNYPTAEQIKASLESIDKASLNQNPSAVFENFEDIANVVVGSHWTEFSNEYGSCASDIGTATNPAERYNPKHPEECFSERCSDALEKAMRYRVCVLPDHPDVAGVTGNANFIKKLQEHGDTKLNRFKENNELEGIISNDDYTAAYGDMMDKDFTAWVPAHGFPRELPRNDCSNDILSAMNAVTNGHGASYKNTDQTFCEYDEAIGAFVGCSNQLYHSVNPRCDPKMYFLGVTLLDANDATVDKDDAQRLTDDGYLEKLTEVLDELERAHYLWEGKYTFNGVEKQITGTASQGAIVTESYLVQVDVDKHCPEPNCPVPQPWTEWTCHCGNSVNVNGIPLCCNDKRKRFRGCDANCGNDLTCKKVKDKLATLNQCPINDAACGATSSAWTTDNWFSADNILTNGAINSATAVDLILNTYKSTSGSLGDLYGFTDDDVRAFLTATTYHKNINIAEITKYVELNCLNADNGNNNLIDEFDRCYADKNPGVAIDDFHEALYPKAAANVGDFYALRGGAVISVNVADKVDSQKYADSAFYQHGAQNIYAEYEKLSADRLNRNVYTTTDTCQRPGTVDSDEVVVQCEVVDSGNLGGLGYANDKRQRNNWVLNNGFLSLPTDYNTGGIVGALVDWFESFDCPAEMAWEEDSCPARPRIVSTDDDTCVTAYSETAAAKCAEGFVRDTLVVQIDYEVGGGATKSFNLYWNEATGEYGDPNGDNFEAADWDGTATTADYEARKAELAALGVTGVSLDCDPNACELCATPPVPCKNPCEYTPWSDWGSWAISANDADSQTAFSGVNPAPVGGSGWFNGRDDCGEVLAEGQCFRVFENAASLQNVQKFIDEAIAVLADANASDADKLFAVRFLHSWVKDGAYAADSATFVADAEAAIGNADAAAASTAADGVTFTAKYEVVTDEGFHLDVIKQWLTGTDMAPHGWRFSCRHRGSTVKGYKARHRDPDCDASVANPDCCGLVDLEECELPICPDWTAWSEYSECSADCQVSGIGHGYKIQGRNCEADTNTLMTQFTSSGTGANAVTGERVVIQLPESQYIGCSCDTLLADETMDSCQTTSFIASTADQCRWRLDTCNTDRPCPTKSATPEIVQACPVCGTQAAVEISKQFCVQTGTPKADWDDVELTAASCGITNEMTVTDCELNSCNGVTISSDCVDGSRSKIVNGEVIKESCGTGGPTVWSDWTECPASCAGRPAGQQFRFSAQAETESRACPESTDPCPAWSDFGEWGECVDGNHSRSRTCENATNGGGPVGAECAGDATETCGC